MPERSEHGGERALGGMVERPVLELEPAAADADLGLLLHQLEQAVERSLGDARVGVERENVGRVAAADGLVVGS